MTIVAKIGDRFSRELVSAAEAAFHLASKTFRAEKAWEYPLGGYFCIADGITGTPYLTILIGEVENSKADRYYEFCREKAQRLAANPDHLSSWQSRDERTGQYGGAIRVGRHILSFSGLPELGDEAILLAASMMWCNRLGMTELLKPLSEVPVVSNNHYWEELKEKIELETAVAEHAGT